MVQAPLPSDIPNVFGLNQPQHLVSKLYFELQQLMESLSVWTKSGSFPEPLFIAFNTAVTAWHITDWLWESKEATRASISKRFKFQYNEWPQNGRSTGLERFQDAVAKDSRPLYICREIANASKHMRKRKSDPTVKAIADWHPAVEAAGHAKVGDLILSLTIVDGDKQQDATYLFIEAAGYWEKRKRPANHASRDIVIREKMPH
jgi:hypothetical protein